MITIIGLAQEMDWFIFESIKWISSQIWLFTLTKMGYPAI